MRPLMLVVTAVVLMALAFWAYRENYATQQAIRDVTVLQQEISELREALTLQRAEWAYLNRPERLRDLIAINFDRMQLLPMESAQFGRVDQVAYPLPPEVPMPLADPIDVIGDQEIPGEGMAAEAFEEDPSDSFAEDMLGGAITDIRDTAGQAEEDPL
jgi:hypothetical protein